MIGTSTLKNIQALRLFAAALVFLQHAYFFSSQVIGDAALDFRKFNFGGVGVYVFFIISGFVIALQTDKKPKLFASHRLARIYPAYCIALITSTAIFYLFSTHRPALSNWASLLLFPSGSLNDSFQVPYWTLIYEMFFYTFIVLLMLLTRARAPLMNAALLLWLASILVAGHNGVSISLPSPDYTTIFLSPLNIFFITGYFLARLTLSPHKTSAYMGFLLIGAESIFFAESRYLLSTSLVGAMLILFAIQLKPFPKLLTILGDYSYGIYLLHLPIIYCLYLALKASGATFHTSLLLMTLVALPTSIAFGKFEYWLYQQKIRPMVDRLLSHHTTPQLKQPLEQP
ncbi:acyltransferase family protein [Pseudomonas sp. SMV71]|uniref:acyltransferase family protein n=1 Tax=Pseudomonas sp. SMV71 TaxID=3390195 RepID=UPI003F867238